ncbi:uncharacterized protein LOC114531892 isoform X2 [Dendronephthya gigantea]|uniref:uncharacterized protein LOC114531892 isoform X2 n=1 Tax=Dendronephthya gigantea TaxID=151771 RepID=UPI00106B2DA6|nr:uncharacterized protein LOC114531892 isoform X2 [Dendronephthya gigantea]
MAFEKSLFLIVFLLSGIECRVIIGGTDCSYNCRATAVEDRRRCILGCRLRNEGRSARIQRASEDDNSLKGFPRTSRIKRNDDCSFDSKKFLNPRHGIKRAKAKIRKIVFSLDKKNKTVARIIWDPLPECLKRKDYCKGYFVQWSFASRTFEGVYCTTVNNTSDYIILDESTGFNGRSSFDVKVKAFPYTSTEDLKFFYMDPPAPESLSEPRVWIFTTPNPTDTLVIPSTNSSLHVSTTESSKSLSPEANNSAKEPHNKEEISPTTLIFSLSVFAVVIIATVFLVVKWFLRPKKNDFKITSKSYEGTVYVSYLPEKSTINQVNEIYSLLKSHNINVVMDQMYDPKLYNSLGPERFGEKFLAHADKVIMIVTQGYLKLCRLDETVDIGSRPCFNSLNDQRLYGEVVNIKSELSTKMKHSPVRFIPVLVNVADDYLPKWLQKLTSVTWPDDWRNSAFLNLLSGDDAIVHEKDKTYSFA